MKRIGRIHSMADRVWNRVWRSMTARKCVPVLVTHRVMDRVWANGAASRIALRMEDA